MTASREKSRPHWLDGETIFVLSMWAAIALLGSLYMALFSRG